MKKQLLVCVLLVPLMAGCAGSKPIGGGPGLTLLSDGVLPAPTLADYRGFERPYAIGPFDKLRVDVAGMPELSLLEVQTDAGGSIGVPLAGQVRISGMTTTEASQAIRERLRAAYIRDPKVTVNMRDATSQVLTVEGQVTRPGQYPALANMTLLGAVAKAEGTNEFANLKEVIVFRTVANKRYAALYDVRAIRRGTYGDPPIFANDLIVVGDSPQRKLFRDFIQILPLLTTPLIVALQK